MGTPKIDFDAMYEKPEIKIKQVYRGFELKAKVSGDNVIESYDIKTTIKAVTYQEMEIEHSKEGFMLQVVVDI